MKTIILITLLSLNAQAYDKTKPCEDLRGYYEATLKELNSNPDLSPSVFLKSKTAQDMKSQDLAFKIYQATRKYLKGADIGLRRKNIPESEFLTEVELHCLKTL